MKYLILKIIKTSFKLQKAKFLFLFILIFISMAFELLGISLIMPAISVVLNPDKYIEYKNFFGFNFFSKKINVQIGVYFLIIFLIVIFFRYIIGLIVEIKIVKYTRAIETDLINRVLKLQFNTPWKDLLLFENKKINKLLLSDIGVYVSSGILLVLDLTKSLLILALLFCFLIYNKGAIVVYIVIITVLFFIAIKNISKNKLQEISKYNSDITEFRYEFIGQLISGLRELKILQLLNFYINKYYQNEVRFTKIEIQRKLAVIIPKMLVEFLILISIITLVILNLSDIKNKIPFAGAFAFILFRTQPLISNILISFSSLQLHQSQINQTQVILDKIVYESKFIREKTQNTHDSLSNISFKNINTIELKNVSFDYNNTRKVFKDLNVKFQNGNIYGIKGANGTGKSTLADLLTGLLEPDKGMVCVNNINIKTVKNWKSNIAYLSQSFFLFNDTIKNNIVLNFSNKTKIDNKLYNFVIEVTGLNIFFDSLITGDNTVLLDLGKNLSGGQKQKIAIARVLYKNVDLIIFDEATSNLDKKGVDDFCEIQKKIKNNKIIINISHSDAVLNISDKIFEIKDNKIILI
ncbi:ABC transporter ATP-binding protein [Candidatus Fonsibacter ubiquis]|uniref:ATP-binding cassette domain-containing protein n=1 Tax=Candidatus Fonsibacter ubiquis TaxID=1925548 RepID=UPI000C08222E|nr:ABC transporter ATP-binding protein [Candidatus Fonsibacter ubiquis]